MIVEEFMTSPVVVVSPGESLARVRNLMIRYGIGRLVVVDEYEKPIGIITKTDIAEAVASAPRKELDQFRVDEVMTREPITISVGSSVREAARILLEKNIGGLPVVDRGGRLVGIITKTDLVKAYLRRKQREHKVSEYMYTDVPVVSPTHSVNYVAELIVQTPAKRVLVVDSGKLVGIIAPSDLAFASGLVATRRSKKLKRRFVELEKGRLGPVYSYLITIAADVMTPNPISLERDQYLSDAALLMLNNSISSIPVVDSGEPLGVVTKHSILAALIG